MLRRAYSLVATLALTTALSSCGTGVSGQAVAPGSSVTSAPPSTSAPASSVPSTAPPSTPPAVKKSTTSAPPPVASGTVVVLDPGHNGGNASHPAEINRQVPAGRGQTKACNTTGTSTNAGYTEHAFTWSVATQVRDILTARGVKVVLTRQSDTGVGPCVNERASTGNQAGAAAVVSIHADGSTSAGAHGFHVAYSSPPLNAAQGEPSLKLARTLRDGLRSAGFPTSNYIGSDGLSPRSDLGGLNLSERPTALVECGNMRDATEAATLSSADGRAKYAAAIANAILAYLS